MAAPEAFNLWLVMDREQKAHCEARGLVPLDIVGQGRSYIGLRQNFADAKERVRISTSPTIDPTEDTHIALLVQFTEKGLARFATEPSGANDAFAPILSKIIYKNDTTRDWFVWHYIGDIPFRFDDPNSGELLITTSWVPLGLAGP